MISRTLPNDRTGDEVVERGLINSLGGQRVVNIRDSHDSAGERYFLSLETCRVARAIEPLVVGECDLACHLEKLSFRMLLQCRLKGLGAQSGVRLHDGELDVVETPWLEQYAIRDRHFPNVVQGTGFVDRSDEASRDLAGVW